MSAAAIHNREKLFYEEHARLSLIDLFPNRFSPSMVIEDKPDLPDHVNGIGVEVTRAMVEGSGEANGFFQKIRGEYLSDVDFKKVDQFEKRGNELLIHEGKIEGYSSDAYLVSDEVLIQAFKAKIEALNKSDFTCFEVNDLYIFSPEFKWYGLEDINQFTKKIVDIQFPYSNKFDTVYINDFGYFFKCNLKEATSCHAPVSDEQLRRYNVLAKEFVDSKRASE